MEDVPKELGEGYGQCLGRLSALGLDVIGHSFKEYIRDYATGVQNEARSQLEDDNL